MSTNNEPIFTLEEDNQLQSIFAENRKQKAIERQLIAEQATHQQNIREKTMQAQKDYLTNQIINTTEYTVNNLYPDLPLINPKKSVARSKIPCTDAREVKEEFLTVLGYLTDETIYRIKNTKKEIGNIFFMLAITTAVISGGATLLLDLPIAIFLEYGVAPALIEGLIGSIVDPKTREIYKDKFQDFFYSKLDNDKHSGRRH